MDHPFSSKGKEIDHWNYPREQMDGLAEFDLGVRSLLSEVMLSPSSELMNLDSFAGWCNSPPAADLLFTQYGLSPSQPMPSGSSGPSHLADQKADDFSYSFHREEGSYSGGERSSMQQMVFRLDPLSDGADSDKPSGEQCSGSYQNNSLSYTLNHTIPKSFRHSLDEKMLKALGLFMESSGEGILAQVWTPIKMGDQYMLSTCDQAYLLDPKLSGYREASRKFSFSAEANQCSFPGLPGRVFMSGLAEWTSNVIYYKTAEYLRMKYAIDNEVRGSIAIPILEATGKSCAVLELVTIREKQNFASELESVCRALQAVNLQTSVLPRFQYISSNQREALAEIGNVLRAVCHAHRLPLALTWIPCCYSKGSQGELVKVYGPNPDGNSVLCIEETACYVNDTEMEGFVQACLEHHLREAEGVAGKAFISNQPFFSSDIKTFDISEYPLVQHARKYGLNAAVAIKLRSTYTGDHDYILEFFLPVTIKGSSEQQLLLDNLSGTMQRICRTLMTASDAEVIKKEVAEVGFRNEKMSNFPQMDISQGSFQTNHFRPLGGIFSNMTCDNENDMMESQGTSEKVMKGSRKSEKKKSTTEKNVSLSVLQQYFSGSLKDAAKSLGVCPTTLKRICRQHGIMRWPCRKINKVNRSLKRIQTVLDSVQGIDGGLKYDATLGEFVAADPLIQEFDAQKGPSSHYNDSYEGVQEDISEETSFELLKGKSDNNAVKLHDDGGTSQAISRLFPDANVGDQPSSWVARHSIQSDGMEIKNGNSPFNPKSLRTVALEDEKAAITECSDSMVEPNQPMSCSISDSSNASGAVAFRSSSTSMEDPNPMRTQNSTGESRSNLTVKATYKGDTVRFKFDPSVGCPQLYKEVGRRFKLQDETFQLKYLDDEEEWVMLVTDSDLHECLEILESMGRHTVKFLVRDLPCAVGSSAGSNGYLLTNT